MKTIFLIPIGDWSGDGHGYAKYFACKTNKSLDNIREAYFTAKERHAEELCPENFLCEYEDNTVSIDFFNKMLKTFPNLSSSEGFYEKDGSENQVSIFAEFMADYVVEFIKSADPDLEIEIMSTLPMLPFFGFDTKSRHISFIGYGPTSFK